MRIPVIAILVCALYLPVLSENDAGIGISEKPAAKGDATVRPSKAKDTVTLAPSFTKDTIAPGAPAAGTESIGASGGAASPASNPEAVTIGNEQRAAARTPATSRNLEDAFKSGKALTTAGLILHASGLGVTVLGAGIQSSDGSAQAVSSLIGSTALYLGPIFSCVGATKVEHGLKEAGYEAENPRVWAEYGWGWLCEAGCVGLALGAVGVLSQSSEVEDPSQLTVPILMIVGAVACEVIGEVEWMKCVIHAKTYVSRMEKKAHGQHASVTVIPYYTLNGTAGTRMKVGF
jgi:hypothetical protein